MRGVWGRCCALSLVPWSGYGVGVVVTGECGEVCRKNPGDRTCCVAGVGPLCPLVWPSRPHVGLLFRAWAIPPTCGIGGPRVGWPVDVWNRQTACRRRWPYSRLAASRANPLCGAWAFSSARGPAISSLGNPAHMRNRRPTCGTGGPRAGCEGARVVVACGQSVTDRGAAAHARDAVCAWTRQLQPTTASTFLYWRG